LRTNPIICDSKSSTTDIYISRRVIAMHNIDRWHDTTN
jgi:hypothetical protein